MHRGAPLEKELPACSICLVCAVLTCHSLVLVGNLATARSFEALGSSVTGWSLVGLALGESLGGELDVGMSNVSSQLTEALAQIDVVQDQMDGALKAIGQDTDDATIALMEEDIDGTAHSSGASYAAYVAGNSNGTLTRSKLHANVKRHMQPLEQAVEKLFGHLKKALKQVGEWLVSFGDKVQGSVEAVSVTVDKVQKLFDNLMVHFAPTVAYSEELEYDTFNLLDVDGDGVISVSDLQNVSAFYGVEALQGSKSDDLVEAHDTNHDDVIDQDEYTAFVQDESVPGLMAMVLRQYARQLSVIAGNVQAARMRDEVAHAVVEYLDLVVAKNMTKVGWVADRLTNGSLPLAFTADVLKGLAMDASNANKKTLKDVGLTVVSEMMSRSYQYTLQALELMSDASFWESEGFDPDDQATCVSRVAAWTTAAADTNTSLVQGKIWQMLAGSNVQLAGSLVGIGTRTEWLAQVYTAVTSRSKKYIAQKLEAAAARHQRLMSSKTSAVLFQAALGGQVARLQNDPEATMAVQSGVPAVPATLQFAEYLAWNASSTADRLQRETFNATGTSSNPLQSFANEVKGMTSKFTNVLKMLNRYASPTGFQQLRDDLHNFVDNATGEIMPHVEKRLVEVVPSVAVSLSQLQQPADDVPSGVWLQMNDLLKSLKVALPSVISNLKFARREVSAVAVTLDSIFGVLYESGEPLFIDLAAFYKALWITYFVTLSVLTLLLLVYAFWAGGYLSMSGTSVQATPESQPYVQPTTFRARCYSCCCSCCACMRSCEDTALCFWSVIILAELVALILFLVAILLSVLAGGKAFVASGCSQVYILNDTVICSGMLLRLQDWLRSFVVNGHPMEVVCSSEALTTCEIVADKMRLSLTLTLLGSFPAAILTFQMILEAGVLHERARWRQIINDGLDNNPPS
mmetsp:Transcript_4769/g.8184  ORF Transcript_4769/g.8184 Transcript_4769/m.8184 type:complete len:916 (+) Transcript_4769:172-2919(+)